MQLKNARGQTVNGEQMTFEVIKEGYSEYKLSDGKILKVRVVVSEVFRLDEVDESTGRNNYFIKSQPILSIEEPKK